MPSPAEVFDGSMVLRFYDAASLSGSRPLLHVSVLRRRRLLGAGQQSLAGQAQVGESTFSRFSKIVLPRASYVRWHAYDHSYVAHAFSCLLDSTILVHMSEPFWASLDRYSAVRDLSSLVMARGARAEDPTSYLTSRCLCDLCASENASPGRAPPWNLCGNIACSVGLVLRNLPAARHRQREHMWQHRMFSRACPASSSSARRTGTPRSLSQRS